MQFVTWMPLETLRWASFGDVISHFMTSQAGKGFSLFTYKNWELLMGSMELCT